MSPADEKLWSTLTHIGGILTSFVAPLIIYVVFKDRGPFVRWHTAQALNFQLTALIAVLAVTILTLVTVGFGGILFLPLIVLVILLPILAAVAANKGQYYKYPATITFVR